MNTIVKDIKLVLKHILKNILRSIFRIIFCFAKTKPNYVYFDSFSGKQVSCNPYYIYKYLLEHDLEKKFKFVWAVVDPKLYKDDERTRYIKFNSFKWIYFIITSKVVISNNGFSTYIPFKKKQILINTWHGGGAYKKVGREQNDFSPMEKKYSACDNKYINKHLSVYISSSTKFTEVMTESTTLPAAKFYGIGMPRNDIFFDNARMDAANKKVREQYKIEADSFLVLYAPTFRGNPNNPDFEDVLNIKKLKETLQQKTGKKIYVTFRGHYFFTHDFDFDFDIDWTHYPFMQELLCAADMLITDYSSTMWDFSLTYKPCFLFASDIEKYIKDRGFYTAPYSWGFPIVKTNEELAEKIMNFDKEKFVEAMKKHHKDLGSFEDGHATEKICKFIEEEIKKC